MEPIKKHWAGRSKIIVTLAESRNIDEYKCEKCYLLCDMHEAWEPSVRFSSEPWNTNAPAADGTEPTCGGGGWLTGLAEGVRPGVCFRRITTWDSGGVDLTGWLPPDGAASFSTCPSTAILRFMYFSKMASRRAFSSAFRRSSSSCLLLQQTRFPVSCTSLSSVHYHWVCLTHMCTILMAILHLNLG